MIFFSGIIGDLKNVQSIHQCDKEVGQQQEIIPFYSDLTGTGDVCLIAVVNISPTPTPTSHSCNVASLEMILFRSECIP